MTYWIDRLYTDKAQEYKKMFEMMPVRFKPTVTLTNAEDKYIERYFVQYVNDKDYIVEVDQKQFETFKDNPRFVSVKVQWRIVGVRDSFKRKDGVVEWGVAEINRQAVLSADLTMKGLAKYIINYLEFWQSER